MGWCVQGGREGGGSSVSSDVALKGRGEVLGSL